MITANEMDLNCSSFMDNDPNVRQWVGTGSIAGELSGWSVGNGRKKDKREHSNYTHSVIRHGAAGIRKGQGIETGKDYSGIDAVSLDVNVKNPIVLQVPEVYQTNQALLPSGDRLEDSFQQNETESDYQNADGSGTKKNTKKDGMKWQDLGNGWKSYGYPYPNDMYDKAPYYPSYSNADAANTEKADVNKLSPADAALKKNAIFFTVGLFVGAAMAWKFCKK